MQYFWGTLQGYFEFLTRAPAELAKVPLLKVSSENKASLKKLSKILNSAASVVKKQTILLVHCYLLAKCVMYQHNKKVDTPKGRKYVHFIFFKSLHTISFCFSDTLVSENLGFTVWP